MSSNKAFGLTLAALLAGLPASLPAEPLALRLAEAGPAIVDGDLGEWDPAGWQRILLEPATQDDPDNHTGRIEVEFQARLHADRLYVAARWPDAAADTDYRPWRWVGGKYRREPDRDDMFALRFDFAGDFNECMLADAEYRVDTWLWSAGRSDLAGYATDMSQSMSTRMQEDAAEYRIEGGKTVYIKRYDDAGTPGFANTRPDRRNFAGRSLPGIELLQNPGGSLLDVAAKGLWREGVWALELSRALQTGHADDRQFDAGAEVLTQIAVFNRGHAEHKSVSAPIRLIFPAAP